MTARRPPGPVFRPDNDDTEGDDMTNPTAELHRRWKYLQDGAALGGNLTALARRGTMPELAAALQTMTREQLEAATFAMVLVHAENASLANPDDD